MLSRFLASTNQHIVLFFSLRNVCVFATARFVNDFDAIVVVVVDIVHKIMSDILIGDWENRLQFSKNFEDNVLITDTTISMHTDFQFISAFQFVFLSTFLFGQFLRIPIYFENFFVWIFFFGSIVEETVSSSSLIMLSTIALESCWQVHSPDFIQCKQLL